MFLSRRVTAVSTLYAAHDGAIWRPVTQQSAAGEKCVDNDTKFGGQQIGDPFI